MSSEWISPKTDWESSDYFNIEDYNRIISNMDFLHALAIKLFENFDITSMGEEKTYMSMIYAREMNVIERNLDTINQNTYGLGIGQSTLYQTNQGTPLWSEFNRIESASLLLYNTMMAHERALPRLAFVLGAQKGIKA